MVTEVHQVCKLGKAMRASIFHKKIDRKLACRGKLFMKNIWRMPNHEQKESSEAAVLLMALVEQKRRMTKGKQRSCGFAHGSYRTKEEDGKRKAAKLQFCSWLL